MAIEPVHKHFPQVPLQRRAGAFLIDFVCVWLISSFLAGLGISELFVFLPLWLVWRVIVVARNQGQSLGRWALDMKVLDARFSRIPQLLTLTKREGITGLLSLLAVFGFSIGSANSLSLVLLIVPLLVDWGTVMADSEGRQAFHDRIAGTLVVQTKRGFSLDLRVRRLLAQVTSTMRK
ncbi:MAG: RDD family protein [Coleofasciculaceae cyanobacterium]